MFPKNNRQENSYIKKAAIVFIIKIVIVILINKAISIYILGLFHATKDITTPEVADLANKKLYYLASINVLLSVLLFFVLKKVTSISKLVILILCFLSFFLNIIIPSFW